MHIRVRCGAERKGEELLRPNPPTRQMVPLAHPLASSICLGLSESEQNPIFFPSSVAPILVLNNGAKSSQTVSGKAGRLPRLLALGCGDGKKGALAARRYGSKRRGV